MKVFLVFFASLFVTDLGAFCPLAKVKENKEDAERLSREVEVMAGWCEEMWIAVFTVFTDVAEVKIEVAARAQACHYVLKDIHI